MILNSEELPGWIVLGQAKALGMFGKGWAWIVTDAISIRNSTYVSLDGVSVFFLLATPYQLTDYYPASMFPQILVAKHPFNDVKYMNVH